MNWRKLKAIGTNNKSINIQECDLCNNKGYAVIIASSLGFPFIGRTRNIVLCNKHHKQWENNEIRIYIPSSTPEKK